MCESGRIGWEIDPDPLRLSPFVLNPSSKFSLFRSFAVPTGTMDTPVVTDIFADAVKNCAEKLLVETE